MLVFAVMPVRALSGLAMLVLGAASCAPSGLVRSEVPAARAEDRIAGGAPEGAPATDFAGDPPATRGGIANGSASGRDRAPSSPEPSGSITGGDGTAFERALDGSSGDVPGGYPLDTVSRAVSPAGRLRCDTSELVSYRGTSLRLQAPVRVHRAFIPYVQRFETLARDVAVQIYGRPPRSMAHAGAFNCRRIRRVESVLSEHALGNAIDIRGFDFGSASREQPVPEDVPGRFGHSFRVRVEDHWVARDARWTAHERFFAALRVRLQADPDLFTVMLGPSYPGHRNHLHFDRSPFRFVQF